MWFWQPSSKPRSRILKLVTYNWNRMKENGTKVYKNINYLNHNIWASFAFLWNTKLFLKVYYVFKKSIFWTVKIYLDFWSDGLNLILGLWQYFWGIQQNTVLFVIKIHEHYFLLLVSSTYWGRWKELNFGLRNNCIFGPWLRK